MTQLWRAPRPLVLASKSAARRGLLEAAGIPVVIEGAGVDERAIEAPLKARGAGGREIAAQLAQAQANQSVLEAQAQQALSTTQAAAKIRCSV